MEICSFFFEFSCPINKVGMFRWVVNVVFPRLIPKHILENIKVVITDGDPQEFLQVDKCNKNVIPNVKRIRCG